MREVQAILTLYQASTSASAIGNEKSRPRITECNAVQHHHHQSPWYKQPYLLFRSQRTPPTHFSILQSQTPLPHSNPIHKQTHKSPIPKKGYSEYWLSWCHGSLLQLLVAITASLLRVVLFCCVVCFFCILLYPVHAARTGFKTEKHPVDDEKEEKEDNGAFHTLRLDSHRRQRPTRAWILIPEKPWRRRIEIMETPTKTSKLSSSPMKAK